MINYRKIIIRIDASNGQLIDEFHERVIRDESLPRLLLADTVLTEFHFLEKSNNPNDYEWIPKIFPELSHYRIIGNSDNNSNNIMFHADSAEQYSNFSQGVISFLINSNSQNFANALNSSKSIKGVFVIYGINSENIDEYFVFAKSNFIAENRPCDTQLLPDEDYLKVLTREELELLLSEKAPKLETFEKIKNLENKITPIENKLIAMENAINGIESNIDTALSEVE